MRLPPAKSLTCTLITEADVSDLNDPHDPLPYCDCGPCARHERNQLRAALASVSEEMGLPPTMGPAKGELKRILDGGTTAIDALRDAPRAISDEANFGAMTWTFQIGSDCRAGAGTYALVWLGPRAD